MLHTLSACAHERVCACVHGPLTCKCMSGENFLSEIPKSYDLLAEHQGEISHRIDWNKPHRFAENPFTC